jgi:hypothetical protein
MRARNPQEPSNNSKAYHMSATGEGGLCEKKRRVKPPSRSCPGQVGETNGNQTKRKPNRSGRRDGLVVDRVFSYTLFPSLSSFAFFFAFFSFSVSIDTSRC